MLTFIQGILKIDNFNNSDYASTNKTYILHTEVIAQFIKALDPCKQMWNSRKLWKIS